MLDGQGYEQPNNDDITWQSITDLPADWRDLASSELSGVARTWQEYRSDADELTQQTLRARINREWSIETGMIEGLYEFDRGITQTLIKQGFIVDLLGQDATRLSPERVMAYLRDQANVIEGLFDFVAQRRELSKSYLHEMHCAFTKHQNFVEARTPDGELVTIPLEKGVWKTQPNNPAREDRSIIHVYCPPIQVDSEIERLLDMHSEHTKNNIPSETAAAWLHHRFVQIHPYQDGNGRIARALASLVFLRNDLFPLTVDRDRWTEYIGVLERADGGNLKPLVDFFSKVQHNSLSRAVELLDEITSESPVKQSETPVKQINHIIQSARDRIKKKQELERVQILETAASVAAILQKITIDRFTPIAEEISGELNSLSNSYFSDVYESDEKTAHWFRHQINTTAKNIGYFADTDTFRAWVRLRIRVEQQTDIIVSFHSLGKIKGWMAVSAYLQSRELESDDGKAGSDDPKVICSDVFRFVFDEDIEQIKTRFAGWLENVILVGLESWRQQL